MTRAQCSVDGCEGYLGWNGMCPKHATRVKRHGDPHALIAPKDRRTGRAAESARWAGDNATYSAVHQRMRTAKGLASKYPCVDCGAVAANWSYDHADPDERLSPEGPFSLNQDHYTPRCLSCHRKFDPPTSGPAVGRPIDRDLVANLHAEGVGLHRMAEQMRVAPYRVGRILEQLGLPRLPAGGKPGVAWKQCRHGHEYTPENTLIDDPEGRRCRICKAAAEKRRAAQKAERRKVLRAAARSTRAAAA